MADRIIVMCDGRITGEVMAKETTQNDILKYATSFENKLGSPVSYTHLTTEYVDGMLLERSDEDGINDYLERLSELSK